MRCDIIIISDMAAGTAVSIARWQQGEQTVAGVGVVFLASIGLCPDKHFTDITDGQ